MNPAVISREVSCCLTSGVNQTCPECIVRVMVGCHPSDCRWLPDIHKCEVIEPIRIRIVKSVLIQNSFVVLRTPPTMAAIVRIKTFEDCFSPCRKATQRL